MRPFYLITLAVLALPLAACQTMTPEERRAADTQTCRGYGFRPGTDALARCLLDLELDRRADSRSWRERNASMNWGPSYIVARPVIVRRR